MCQPKAYHFTDCHAEVLQRLRENVEINLEGIVSWCVVKSLNFSSYVAWTLFILSMNFTHPLISVITCLPSMHANN